jgi:hypothetical protein
MKRHDPTLRYFDGDEYWETPSLAWIHRIRREIDRKRAGKPVKIRSVAEFKRLANAYGLTIRSQPKFQRMKKV